MHTTVFGLKSCDTCRKALKELRKSGVSTSLHDVREVSLTDDQRARFLGAFGDALLNRRSTTWRNLSQADRVTDPDALLMQHPALMKRPVIDGPSGLTLGWDAAARAAHLAR